MEGFRWIWRLNKEFKVRPLVEYMRTVPDPRSRQNQKHDVAEVLTYIVAAYVSGHTSLRRAVAWCKRRVNWLRKGLVLENGIASVATVCRILGNIDEELFLYAFMEWIGEILDTKGRHVAIDGKALRAAVSKVRGGRTPMLMNAIDVATGLVISQFPLLDKSNEIKTIPELLKLLDIKGSIITIDAIATQTDIMEQIVEREAHFEFFVKKNQPVAYEEITEWFESLEKTELEGLLGRKYPEIVGKYTRESLDEKYRDRYEYREYRCCNDAACLSKSRKIWPFVKSVGYIKQMRILRVRDSDGNDITPDREEFLRSGSGRQEKPLKGDSESDAVQVIGVVSDLEMHAKDMGRRKRDHWRVENCLHHVLDDTFREDRSPAKKSKNNLSLIRKFAYNIIRIAKINEDADLPLTEMMDRFADEQDLIIKYIFEGINCIK